MGDLAWLPESAIVQFVQTNQMYFKELLTADYKDGTKATIFALDHPTIDTVICTSDVEACARKYEGRPVQNNYYYERFPGYNLADVLVIRRFKPKANERRRYDSQAGRDAARAKAAYRKEALGTTTAEYEAQALDKMLQAEDVEHDLYTKNQPPSKD